MLLVRFKSIINLALKLGVSKKKSRNWQGCFYSTKMTDNEMKHFDDGVVGESF